jgi:putative ABC transport system permease protein
MLAALALLLAALGVYATLTWEVARARRTIGLRLALGATGRREAGRLIAGAGRTALLGVGVGVVLSYWGSRFLASLVQGVSASDGLSLGMAAGITLVLAPTAAWLAARRAAAVDPADLLRAD